MKILVLNYGSSSQKSAVFELINGSSSDPIPPLWESKLDWDGNHEIRTTKNLHGKRIHVESEIDGNNRLASIERMLETLWSGETAILNSSAEIRVAGHRIVHGGTNLIHPAIITPQVKQAIAGVSAIAPLHNEAGLQGIDLITRLLPSTLQIAVFDTGFHRTLLPAAKVYPGPYEWYERGIRRYGFHGINHEYCARRAAQMVGRDLSSLKIITCHLGNGCSLAAIEGGKSIDTTMGFTPLEGLMMGTRSGSIDPGILTYLVRTKYADQLELDSILNHKSGLLGISGVASDMRDILQATREGNERAKLAFDIFAHRLRAGIAAMAASLGEVDVLVFTAGIGENSPQVRAAACKKLKFLGLQLDEAKNSAAKPDADVSRPDATTRVLVIRAQEDWAIARECARMI